MKLSRLWLVCLVIAIAGAQTTVSLAPRPRPPVGGPPANFRVDARLVQIPVTVTDALDRNVMNLTPENFRIFEGETEQRIAAFSMNDAPISAGIVFDTSGSMKHRIQDSRAAVQQFLATALPEDEFSLVQFSDSANLLAPFTRQPAEILRHLELLGARGWTALYDAVLLSLHQVRRAANPRRVLLILSDGEDNNSRYSESEMLSMVREADVRVYAIGLFTRARCLEKMAQETGGRMITVHNLADLPGAMQKLSLEIRNLYMLGYFPSNAGNDGRYRKVRVEMRLPAGASPVTVSWRRGYLVPND
jgi:VWFA-related protein